MGAPGEGSRNGSGNSVQMADLQNILQNMGLPAQSAGSSTTTSSQGSAGNSSAAATTASTQEGAMDVDEMTEEELLRLAIEESMRDQGGNAGNNDSANKGNGSGNGSGDGNSSGNMDTSSS
jgi:26S proteasome regulatory subunit N13